jgi:glycosyltransferase involved in cell wall biosynthesis
VPNSIAPIAPKSIFIAHASVMLTDHLPHGDGLAAFNFVSRLAARGYRLNVVAENVELSEPLPANVTIHRLPPRRRGHGADQARTAWRIRERFERVRAGERVDVVHQLNPVDIGFTSLLPRDAPPIVLGPYVPSWPRHHTVSGESVGIASRATHAAADALKSAVQWQQQRRAAVLLVSTQAARSRLRSQRAAVRELGYGVDADFFCPAPPPDDPGHEPTVLFLANLQRRKGVLVLLEAFDGVAEAVPGARLLVAGDGPNEEDVKRLAGASPHRDRIELLGRLDRAASAAAMRSADVYCLPSFSEPFGISALEAMSCGRPVVGTNVGGLGHLIRPDGGRAVPAGDPAALAAALTELLRDPDLRRRMGSFNRSLVESRYSWDAVVDELESVYEELAPSTAR